MGPGTPLTDIHYQNNINLTQLQISDYMELSMMAVTGQDVFLGLGVEPGPVNLGLFVDLSDCLDGFASVLEGSALLLDAEVADREAFGPHIYISSFYTQLPRIALKVLQAIFLLTRGLLLFVLVHFVEVIGRNPKILRLKMEILIDCPR